MQPSTALANTVGSLVAADTTQLANALPTKLHLSQAAFTPALTLLIGGVTEATFGGYGAVVTGAAGTQNSFFDPVTGGTIVECKPPVGGWLFKATGASLPQTIYGSYLTDNGSVTLLASQLLSSPVTLTAAGQGLEIPNVRFTFPASPMT